MKYKQTRIDTCAVLITPEMIEAGVLTIHSFGVQPFLPTAGWAEDLCQRVYRAMIMAMMAVPRPYPQKFRVGDRVKPSQYGIVNNIYTVSGQNRRGTVTGVDKFNFPSVRWDGQKTTIKYHPSFVEHDDDDAGNEPPP